jgi:hypothetical protein
MSFEFTCPFCLNRTRVAEEYLGHSGPCAACGKPVLMPTRDSSRRLVYPVQTGREVQGVLKQQSNEQRPSSDRGLLKAMLAISTISLVVVLAVGLWLGLPALRKQMSIAACNSDLDRMKAIVTALNSYCDRYGSYPPPQVVDKGGKPLLSWRVLILPFMGYEALYDQFALDQSWDSPLNLSLIEQMPREFCSANSPDAWGNKQPNYVLLTGASTLFPSSGPWGYRQVSDSPTLLLVETLNGVSGWTEPGEIDIDALGVGFGTSPMRSIGGLHSEVALGVDTQGHGVIIPKTLSKRELEALITPNGQEMIASKDWSIYP